MNDFRDRLQQALPDDPDTSEWADKAVDTWSARSRRRNAVAGVGGAAAVIAAVSLAMTQFGGLGTNGPAVGPAEAGRGSALPAPRTSAASSDPDAPVQNSGCPADGQAYLEPFEGDLPTGAVSLRWCTATDGSAFMNEWTPPELLTQRLDDWISTYNALQTAPADRVCPANYSTPGAAVLTYPDGSTRTVGGMAAGCGTIGGRLGFDTMRSKTIELYQSQRGEAFVPTKASFTPCAAFQSTIPGRLHQTTSAALCAFGPDTAKLIAPDAVAALVRDISDNLERYLGSPNLDGPTLHLYQDNGEMLVLQFSSEKAEWLMADGPNAWKVWKPNETSQKVLAAARAASPAPSSSSSSPSVPMEVNDPCMSTLLSASGTDPLPLGATKVWMCSTYRYAPPEPLEGERAAKFAQTTHGSIEPCIAQPGDESFIAEYPDGRRVRLMIPKADCMQQVSAMQEFPRMLAEQRSETGLAKPLQNMGKLCDLDVVENVMPMALGDVTTVRHCRFTMSLQDERHTAGVLLSPAEQKLVMDDLRANSVRRQTRIPAMRATLALLRDNGERIWVRHADANAKTLYWQLPGAEDSYEWTPTPQVQKILDRLTTTGE
ncbi:hypothetical protein [Aestuariimicrobium ganziense]|uniref:hypothetical protein n=1 Tax=Aestuariimicrobium ganziense TaxID=2773677 RepID=UPI0019434846|nr:hypothetical protein [Aestuariimicrobium ganziense]